MASINIIPWSDWCPNQDSRSCWINVTAPKVTIAGVVLRVVAVNKSTAELRLHDRRVADAALITYLPGRPARALGDRQVAYTPVGPWRSRTPASVPARTEVTVVAESWQGTATYLLARWQQGAKIRVGLFLSEHLTPAE